MQRHCDTRRDLGRFLGLNLQLLIYNSPWGSKEQQLCILPNFFGSGFALKRMNLKDGIGFSIPVCAVVCFQD